MNKAGPQPLDQAWSWTLISGGVTLLLAVVAFFLPDIDVLPKGGIVGWLLLLAGLLELAFGLKRGLGAVAQAAVGSGVITALAGLLFVANPAAGYFPIANIVMAWLFLRGAWVLAMALRLRGRSLSAWLVLSGATDLLLAFALLANLQIVTLVYLLFGPTPEVVARFALILAASFLVTAIAQIAIALADRRKSVSAAV